MSQVGPLARKHGEVPAAAHVRREPQTAPAVLEPLLLRITARYRPLEIWLFGSHARGEAHQQSDWDLMVIISDDAPEDLLDPMLGWEVQRGSGVYADIVCARQTEFLSDLSVANTAAREVERDGILLYAA
jgi:uncharacterized protein